jgi:hypothetical protein
MNELIQAIASIRQQQLDIISRCQGAPQGLIDELTMVANNLKIVEDSIPQLKWKDFGDTMDSLFGTGNHEQK